jgi:hypothetical protein
MERSWLETVQLLGLDVELVLVLVMLVLDQAVKRAGRLRGALGKRAGSQAPPVRLAGGSLPKAAADPWSPQEWRPSH